MVYKIEVTPQDVAASRFAISPLIETMHAQWLLDGRGPAGVHRQWVDRWRPAYRELTRRHPALRATAVISGNRGDANVDFIAPPRPPVWACRSRRSCPPSGRPPSSRRTPRSPRCWPAARSAAEEARALLLGADVVRLIADAYEALWTEIVSREWPHFQAILERDVVHRAGRLAAYGWAAALDGLSEQVRWNGAEPHRDRDGHAGRVVPAGRQGAAVPAVGVHRQPGRVPGGGVAVRAGLPRPRDRGRAAPGGGPVWRG
ncbi:hypothetical protein ACFSTC_07975 [Nonomuraea ferruginea]